MRGPGSPGWGSLKSETVKYGHSPVRLMPKNDCSNCEQQTHLLIGEGAPLQQTHKCLTVIKI
jgi:hypothetical protein